MTNLSKDYWAVKVPKEAGKFEFVNIVMKCLLCHVPNTKGYTIPLGLPTLEEWEIIPGYITKSECTVDADKIVDKRLHTGLESILFMNYLVGGFHTTFTAQESLYSLLESKGIYFVNPMGVNSPEINVECCGFWQDDGFGNPQCCHQPVPDRNSQEAEYIWREFESNLAEKLILIRKL